MKNPRKILVPYDLSEPSRRALRQAGLLASKLQATLSVLYVLEPTPYDDMFRFLSSEEEFHSKLKSKIQEESAELLPSTRSSPIPIEFQVKTGKPAVQILLTAEREKADLIIMGSHGRTGLKRLWLGSVAERVVQRAGVPVFVHRGEADKLPQKILIPIDFSESSKQALEVGLQWAAVLNSEVHFLHVVGLQDLTSFKDLFLGLDSSLVDSLKKEANDKLSEWIKTASITHSAEIKVGNPSVEIQEAIREHSIDLVVLATHGKTGLKHFFMGSVAEQTVRVSPCSVLTVRPPKFFESAFKLFQDTDELDEYMKDCMKKE